MNNGPDKIIGNVCRPNTAPLVNIEQSIEIHNQILDKILTNKSHNRCEIQIFSDLNVNMSKNETHGQTNDYINALIYKSFLSVITLPTQVKH